jgi:amino acid permease
MLKEEGKIEENIKGSSLFGGYTILAKSMMGSGLLGVAAACAQTGWILGIILAIVIPLLTFLSLHLLATCAIDDVHRSEGPLTFFKICNTVLGSIGAWFVEIFLILKTYGASIVYLQVAGSMLTNLIYTSDISISKELLCRLIQMSIAIVFSPFCFLEKINNTRYVNAIGICCLFFICITACIFFDPSGMSLSSPYPQSVQGVLSKIPIFLFAYTCHQNVFLCIWETRNPTIKRMDIIMALSCITGFIVYMPVEIFPYATYGNTVEDNFLKNLPKDSIVTKTACICAALSVSISFPLQILPLRNSVCSLIWPGRKPTKFLRVIIAGIAIVAALGVALAVSSLGIVMSITGLVGGNTICFFAPSLLYIRKFKRDHSLWYMAAGLLGLSLVLYPLCLVGIILTA